MVPITGMFLTDILCIICWTFSGFQSLKGPWRILTKTILMLSIIYLVVASLSYDHLGAEQGGEGAKYDLLHNAAVPSPHYEYPEVPLPRHTTKQEGDYSYPETRVNKNDIEEHFYEAIPLNDKSKIKEPSPYIEASALTTPKFTGMSGKAPPRPTYKPNEKSSDRLQGLNDLMASLEDIKVPLG